MRRVPFIHRASSFLCSYDYIVIIMNFRCNNNLTPRDIENNNTALNRFYNKTTVSAKMQIRGICIDKSLLKSKWEMWKIIQIAFYQRVQVEYHLSGTNYIRKKSNLNDRHLFKTWNSKCCNSEYYFLSFSRYSRVDCIGLTWHNRRNCR